MNLPTSGGASSTITISGATNSTLGSNGQQLCQICIDMNHDAVQELDVTLFAPDGSSVELILDTGLAINDDITFQICWVSCDQTANPDAGFPAVFDSDAGWQVGETYTGSYYPANGCLEDLTGDVNGDWELDFFDNHSFSCFCFSQGHMALFISYQKKLKLSCLKPLKMSSK